MQLDGAHLQDVVRRNLLRRDLDLEGLLQLLRKLDRHERSIIGGLARSAPQAPGERSSAYGSGSAFTRRTTGGRPARGKVIRLYPPGSWTTRSRYSRSGQPISRQRRRRLTWLWATTTAIRRSLP